MSRILIILLLTSSLLACKGETRDAGRSGTYQDDNLEAPISEKFKHYEPALYTSNQVLDLLKSEQYQAIEERYVLSEIKPLLSRDKIQSLMIEAEKKYGKIIGYKPMQWGFEPKTDNGKRDRSEINKDIAQNYGNKKANKEVPILFCVKIVEHEKATLNYWFQFASDGNYNKLIGIYFKEKKGTRHIGQI